MTHPREVVQTRELDHGRHIASLRQYSGPKCIRVVYSAACDTAGQAISDARARLRARLAQLEETR